jgi:hypothetical protein
VATRSEVPAQFTPLHRASKPRRVLAFVVGPLLWLVAFVVVSVVLNRVDAIERGLAVTLIAFLLSLVLSALGRRRRLREERS